MKQKDLELKFNLKLTREEFYSVRDLNHNEIPFKIEEIKKSHINPSENLKREIYRLHKEVVNSKVLSDNKKEKTLNILLAYEPWSWRVVGISKKAIKMFKANKFRKLKKDGPQRDHYFQERNVTIRKMMEKVMPFETWWDWFWENDRTLIITKEEHAKKSLDYKNDIIKIDNNLGLFRTMKTVGYSFYPDYEAKLVEKLSKEYNL